MKILLVGSYKYEMYAAAFSSGFKQLGHDVIDIDYEQFHIKGKGFLASFHNRFQDRFHYGLMMQQYNTAIIEAVEKEKPHFVFFYRCYHVWPSTMKRLKALSLLLSYNNDDPFSKKPSESFFRYHVKCSYYCDINFVYRQKNIDDYAKLGINNAQILLPYFLSWQNYPIECKKDIPIAFIGHFEADGRDYTIKKLRDAGLPVCVFGREYRWKESKLIKDMEDIFFAGVRGVEYNKILNRTRIALVFLSHRNHDTYTRRCFEIPASSSLMMAPYTNELNQLFEEGKEAVYYKNDEDLIEKCKYYLNHENELNKIASNGYKRLLEIGGSEIYRCSEILKTVELLETI